MRTVRVTAEHIFKGTRGHADNCPVALAVTDSLSWWERRVQKKKATANSKVILIHGGGRLTSYDTPKVVAEFIQSYDTYGLALPFSFELDA